MTAAPAVADEEKVNWMVQQWLQERGYTKALKALQEESYVEIPEDGPAVGGQLAAIIYEHWEMKKALESTGPDPLDYDRREAEEEILALPEATPFPCSHVHTIANVHAGNVIAVSFNNDSSLIATGSTDRAVRILDSTTRKSLRSLALHSAPVLCVVFCPSRRDLLISTAMDGSVVLSLATTGRLAHELKPHTKYAHRAVWSRCGDFFATLGHDKCVYVFKVSDASAADAADKGEGEGEEGVGGAKVTVELVRKKDFTNIPEAACFLDDSTTLVVAVRSDNYFHYLDINSGEVQKVNQNQMGDDHVSFTVLDLVLSPSGKILLASTDRSRLILFVIGTSIQLRWYYGAVNDELCQTRACWHPSSAYIFVTSQDQKIYCWHVASQKVVAQLKGHGGVVRDLDVSHDGRWLISGSFDKTVRIWGVEEAEAASA